MPQIPLPRLRTALCIATLAALAACGDKAQEAAPATSASAAAAPASAPAVQPPATAASSAAAQSAGASLASLRPELGRYPHEGTDYLRQGALAERLRTLLGPQQYEVLLQNLQVSGPLSSEGQTWFITGNRQHEGGAEQAAVVIDPQQDALRVWLVHGGQAQEFADPAGAQIAWPADVRTLQSNAQQK